MGKLFTPQDISSGFNTTNSLNTNFDNIETALDRTLSRYGETPNAMEATLDMNDNPIINAGAIDCSSITIDGQEIASVADLAAQATLAQTAATEADASATAAALSAASVNLPTIVLADAGKLLEVNAAGDGYDLLTQVDSTQIADNAVTTAKILDANVTTAKILDSNITTAKIADANVTAAKLASDVEVPALLSTTNITAVATIDLATAFSANPGYKYYKVTVEDSGLNAAENLWLRVSVDGSTFLSTAIYSAANQIDLSVGTVQASRICYANLLFVNVAGTSHYKLANGHRYLLDSGAATAYSAISSSITTTSAITGFQLLTSGGSGFRAEGTVKVYGSNHPF